MLNEEFSMINRLKEEPEVAAALAAITDPTQRAVAEAQLDAIIAHVGELFGSFSTAVAKKTSQQHK